jgi:hypothetical protein
MKRIKTLVDLLLEDIKPVRTSDYFFGGDDCTMEGDDGDIFIVCWYSKPPFIRCVTLEACEHRIYLSASIDDGGACPPNIDVEYSDNRLKMWLHWLQAPPKQTAREMFSDLLEITYDNGWFNQCDPKTTPRVALAMQQVHSIDSSVWREVGRVLKERAAKEIDNVLLNKCRCKELGYKCPKCYNDSCLCGGVGCNSCAPQGSYHTQLYDGS